MCCEDGGFYVERMMEKDVYLGVIEGCHKDGGSCPDAIDMM